MSLVALCSRVCVFARCVDRDGKEGELLLLLCHRDRALWQTSGSQRSLRWHISCPQQDTLGKKPHWEQEYVFKFSVHLEKNREVQYMHRMCYQRIDILIGQVKIIASSALSLTLSTLLSSSCYCHFPCPWTICSHPPNSSICVQVKSLRRRPPRRVARTVSPATWLVWYWDPQETLRQSCPALGPSKVTWSPSWEEIQCSSDPFFLCC